jgi:hypothetical protein
MAISGGRTIVSGDRLPLGAGGAHLPPAHEVPCAEMVPMSVLQLPDVGPSTEPSMSPDGRWAWDGGQWRPLFSAAPPAKRISYFKVGVVSLLTSFTGCLGAVYVWEIVVLHHLHGWFGIS